MKLIGLTKGIPDYWVILNNYKILAIEFKTQSISSKLSKEQKAIEEMLANNPYIYYKVCRSSHEAVEFVKSLL